MYKSLDTPYVFLELEDDILTATYKKNRKLSLDQVKEIIRTRLDFTEGKPHRVIIYNQGVVTMEKSARDYLSTGDGIQGIVATALIMDTAFGLFLASFFVKVGNPKMPVKVFTKKEAALKWLDKFK